MTYITGWKYKGNIYISSDSAITRDMKVATTTDSTVGEPQIVTDNISINEECFKIVQIENDCLIAISGDVENAIEFVENMRKYSSVDNRFEMLDKLCNAARNKSFNAIVGVLDNLTPKLYHFVGNCENYLQEKELFVSSGSGVSKLASKTESLIKAIKKSKYLPNERLAFFVSGLQLFSISEDVFKSGVGGIFNGARLSKFGITWNNDIAYSFFSNKTQFDEKTMEVTGDSFIVFASNRDNYLHVKSPYPLPLGMNKLIPDFTNKINPGDEKFDDWESKHGNKINDRIYKSKTKAKYLSYIFKPNIDKKRINLLNLSKIPNKIARIEYDGEGWYSVYVSYGYLRELIYNDSSVSIDCKLIK